MIEHWARGGGALRAERSAATRCEQVTTMDLEKIAAIELSQ
jgi:hypothetical protein